MLTALNWDCHRASTSLFLYGYGLMSISKFPKQPSIKNVQYVVDGIIRLSIQKKEIL